MKQDNSVRRSAWKWVSMAVSIMFVVAAFGCSSAKKSTQPTPQPEPIKKEQVVKPEPVTPQPQPPAPEPRPKEAVVLGTVYFDYDKYDLKPAGRDVLAENARVLRNRTEVRVEIQGHCDERGTIEYNLALGEKRARNVMDYLVSLGVNRSQLSIISYGKERPADPRHSEDAWAKNRRAEFVIR